MPLYEYQCPECHVIISCRHSMGKEIEVECGTCKGAVCDKILSAPNLNLSSKQENTINEKAEIERDERRKEAEKMESAHNDACRTDPSRYKFEYGGYGKIDWI